MKLFCLSLALFLLGGRMLAADDATAPILLASQGPSEHNAQLPEFRSYKLFQWKVSPEKWRQTPGWTPGAGPVPLDAHAAAVAALRWINAQPWASRRQEFDGISLCSVPESSVQTHPPGAIWYYTIKFDVKGDAESQLPHQAVVLLDGTVVEPISPTPTPASTKP